MHEPAINRDTPVEVARGRVKPFGKCTPADKRRAQRIGAQKMRLIGRWVELVDELGETWIPQTPFVHRIAAGDLPFDATLADWEREIAKLEAAREMKRRGAGSVN